MARLAVSQNTSQQQFLRKRIYNIDPTQTHSSIQVQPATVETGQVLLASLLRVLCRDYFCKLFSFWPPIYTHTTTKRKTNSNKLKSRPAVALHSGLTLVAIKLAEPTTYVTGIQRVRNMFHVAPKSPVTLLSGGKLFNVFIASRQCRSAGDCVLPT